MNKESIYRIIGYHGKYTDSVKKALKKLLKENHPDHNGDKEIFKLISDVKKELETNQVSFKCENIVDEMQYEDIDIDYCKSMIIKFEKEKDDLEKVLEEHNSELKKINGNYKELYLKSVKEAGKILEKGKSTKKLNEIKKISIILLMILIIMFVIAIIKNSIIIFICFGIICFITIMLTEKYFLYFHEVTQNSEKKVHQYVNTVNSIKEVMLQRQNKEKEILNVERKLKKVENDLRFYNNLLK